MDWAQAHQCLMHTKASCACFPPQGQMVMLTPITHACHPMHSLLRMHHTTRDMRWAWAMRNAYAQHAKCATCTICPCMHAMHGIISAAMRNPHACEWEQYSLHDGHRAEYVRREGRCVCENRRKTREQGLPYSGGSTGSTGRAFRTQRAHKHGLFYILPFFAQNHGSIRPCELVS